MPTNAEIAYTESIRTLEGQAQDLANIRGHVNLALSAGGVAAAFLGTQTAAHGVAFWVAVGAFAALAGLTILVYRPIEFAYDFDGYQLVNDFVDAVPPPTVEDMMRELAVHAADDARLNRTRLDRLFLYQTVALLACGVEVLALVANLAAE